MMLEIAISRCLAPPSIHPPSLPPHLVTIPHLSFSSRFPAHPAHLISSRRRGESRILVSRRFALLSSSLVCARDSHTCASRRSRISMRFISTLPRTVVNDDTTLLLRTTAASLTSSHTTPLTVSTARHFRALVCAHRDSSAPLLTRAQLPSQYSSLAVLTGPIGVSSHNLHFCYSQAKRSRDGRDKREKRARRRIAPHGHLRPVFHHPCHGAPGQQSYDPCNTRGRDAASLSVTLQTVVDSFSTVAATNTRRGGVLRDSPSRSLTRKHTPTQNSS